MRLKHRYTCINCTNVEYIYIYRKISKFFKNFIKINKNGCKFL